MSLKCFTSFSLRYRGSSQFLNGLFLLVISLSNFLKYMCSVKSNLGHTLGFSESWSWIRNREETCYLPLKDFNCSAGWNLPTRTSQAAPSQPKIKTRIKIMVHDVF